MPRYENVLKTCKEKPRAVLPLDLSQDTKQMAVIPVHQITNVIPATDNRLDRTRIDTTADPTLNQLRHYIFRGWPLQKRQLPEPVQLYWNYREGLEIEDGLIFKAHRLVIPRS